MNKFCATHELNKLWESFLEIQKYHDYWFLTSQKNLLSLTIFYCLKKKTNLS